MTCTTSAGNPLPRGAIAACAFASTLLFVLAAYNYPGGNHFEHQAVGHDFWRNALCDVARSTAIGGAPNALGAALARVAMSTMAFGIGMLLWALPGQFPGRPRLGLAVRALAAVTVPAALAVVFLPTDRFSDAHGIAVLLAGLLGTLAATLAVGALLCEARGLLAFLGVATLLASLAALGVYGCELVFGGPPRPAVPVLEHLAALLLLAWMIAFDYGPGARRGNPARVNG